MKFKVIDQSRARDMLDRMDPPINERPSIARFETKAGVGEMLEADVVENLTDGLLLLMREHANDTQAFDADACVLVHRALPDDTDLLSSDGFWRWLALGPLQDIVVWRFPPGKGRIAGGNEVQPKFNRENFGVGASARQRSECYPYKLWLRAELGFTADGDDPYRFSKRGDVDFWTSHVLRQTYTTNRRLCAALVRFQFPDELGGRPFLIPGTEKIDEGRLGIRTLAKRIKRLQASTELTILVDEDLDALLSDLSRDLTRAS
jgi:hypothetical protein